DSQDVVKSVGDQLGFAPSEVRGGVTPEGKLAEIERADNGRIVMVGDGVNDAAAMARATVGIGVKGGAEACLAVADVYLSRPGLAPLAELMERSGRVLGTVRRNIAFALFYNLIGVTLAMLGVLDPLVAAVLMPVSSVTVIAHSWLAGRQADRRTGGQADKTDKADKADSLAGRAR
ncbi:MAG TPA: HAD family hydrolase, partial [Gemmatimonadales bacterium]|nr:HAD family hydrolase [Gemmatimonadales bacterium]